MTVELYQQHMINRNGWATVTEIEAAANLFGVNINIWLQQSSHCTLSSFNASSPTCIDILLPRNHCSPLKRVPHNTNNSFDILKNQLKREGQQNKTSNKKKKKKTQPKLHHIYKKEIDKPNRFIQLSCVKKILKMLAYHIYQFKIKQLECNRKKKAS
jgi:hypothetical protein